MSQVQTFSSCSVEFRTLKSATQRKFNSSASVGHIIIYLILKELANNVWMTELVIFTFAYLHIG